MSEQAAKKAAADPTQERWPTSVAKSNYRSADLTGELVAGVKAHALAHYDEGWDMVVEAMTDDEIVAAFGWALTVAGAVKKVGELVSVHADQRQEVLNA
jgi:hypothetical protein